jgi:cell fate (sporulation/competence/biofilm development) regulator YlbF (YheA/YmcA/DUF963 family)
MVDPVNPYDKAHELTRAITDSEVYKKYVAAKIEVERNPEYKEKILAIRNRQMEINRAQIMGEEASNDTILELSQQFAKANQIKEIADFFNAESSFIQMFGDIQEIIQKGIGKGFE